MLVELTPARDRPLAANIKGADGVELAAVRNANNHAELLRYVGLGRGRLHAAVLDGRAFILVEIGQDRRGFHRLRRKFQRRAGAHRARHLGHRRAVGRDQHAGNAVISPGAGEIALHHRDNRGFARPDRGVEAIDGCFFELERFGRHRRIPC